MTGAGSLWWLSFADPEKPEGEQFLGVCIVEAMGVATAITRSHQLGVNPGGEVLCLKIPGTVAVEWRDRLLTRAEAESLAPDA